MSSLTDLSAVEVRDLLKEGEVTPGELVDAAYQRIEAVDGPVNAMVTLCPDRARKKAADPSLKDTLLAGVPVAIKDLSEVEGVRTTWGSPIYRDFVPEKSALTVETLEGRGAVVIGKSNTPEFGAGAQTFNEVFGKTRNPWNTSLTCAGSSGGSAVALATGMTWLASGSDLGGSLRTPASFCGVVGMRPSPGTVARTTNTPFDTLSVNGPMARTVEDTALMLDAMAGLNPRDPLSRPLPGTSFLDTAREARAPRRVGWSPDLGFLPVDPRVARVSEAALAYFRDMGTEVAECSIDFSPSKEIFQTLRAASFAANHAPKLREYRDLLKPDVVWNIEKGLSLTADDIGRAERLRGELYQTVAGFFGDHDLIVCPVAIVPPFDVDTRYIDEVNGVKFDNYIDWLGMAYGITVTSLPAISVPCGFTDDGLPVGLQLVGRPRGDAELLNFANAFQKATGLSTKPISPIVP